jgi:hypothetical protein
MTPEFIGTCIGLEAKDLWDYDDSERKIKYLTFRKHVGREVVDELDARFGVPLRRDWHVSFERGKWKGRPCVCLHHSAIHHLWYLK